MTRGLNSRAQNRGRHLRMSPRHIDSLADDAERLAVEMGIPQEPEPTPVVQPIGDDFGIGEVIAAFILIGTAALLNVRF